MASIPIHLYWFQVQVIIQDLYEGAIEYAETGGTYTLPIQWSSPLWVALIQVTVAYFCFASAKFACKILIQNFSFTLALNLVGPVTVNLLITFCGIRNANPCAFHNTIPDYLFFEMPPGTFFRLLDNRKGMVWSSILWVYYWKWNYFFRSKFAYVIQWAWNHSIVRQLW